MTPARTRHVLLLVLAVQLVGETALAPYYPALFRRLFGVQDLAASGAYLWAARASTLVALPLWGLAARRWPLQRLVTVGLGAAAAFGIGLAMAPTWGAFTALTVGLVAAHSSLLLAYPAVVAHGDEHTDRVAAIRSYVVVFHAAMVVAAGLGALTLSLPQPRIGIAAFALGNLALVVPCRRLLQGTGPAPPSPRRRRPDRRRAVAALAGAMLPVAVVGALFDLAASTVRPFFTEYVLAGGRGIAVAALLFLLPHAAAVATMTVGRRMLTSGGRRVLPLAAAVAAVGLAAQVTSVSAAVLVPARLCFGAGLGLAHLALDLWVFRATGTDGPAFAAVETARNGALLVAPLLATAVVDVGLAWPLATGAGLLALVAGLSPLAHPAPIPTAEEDDRALEPVA